MSDRAKWIVFGLCVVLALGLVGVAFQQGWIGAGETDKQAGEADGEAEAGKEEAGEGEEEDEEEEEEDEMTIGPPAPEPPPPPLSARYVRVEATRKQFLHLHEIEVYDAATTRITDATATLGPQFGTEEQHGPKHLVDGVFLSNKLAHTAESETAFMQVDLGRDRPISRVILYNRVDCCRDRIVGANVVLRDDAGVQVCRVPIPFAASRYRIDVTNKECALLPDAGTAVARRS